MADQFTKEFLANCYETAFDRHEDDSLLNELNKVEARYTPGELIDCGGMKKINSCYDRFTERELALASMLDRHQDPVDFLREARICAGLEHPNIVPVHDIGRDRDGELFFTMKKLGGENLQSILDQLAADEPGHLKTYTLSKRLEIFLKVCDAIAFAHSKKIIHLDIKPANIQIDEYGQVLACDWGLARDLSETVYALEGEESPAQASAGLGITCHQHIKGSPGYMAPEQINRDHGDRDHQTDVFSIGALLYALLTYERPVEGSDLKQILANTRRGKLTPPSERRPDLFIPEALSAVVMKAMSHERARRYESITQLAEEIRNFINGFATEAEGAGLIKQVLLLIKRHRLSFFILGLSLCTALIFGSIFVKRLTQEKNRALAAKQLALGAKKDETAARLQAEISKDKALKSKIKAEQAEQQATALVQNLKTQKAILISTRQSVARQFMKTSFQLYLTNKQYPNALKTLQHILELDPEFQEAQYYHGLLLLGSFKFKQSYKTLSLYKGPRDTSWLLEACLRFRNEQKHWQKPTWQDILALKRSLSKIAPAKQTGLRRHITLSMSSHFDMPERLLFARQSMLLRNKSKKFTFQFKEINGFHQLSLRGNKCDSFDELVFMKIHDLDLSYTDIKDLYTLRRMPLEKLNISHSLVNNLKVLATIPLKELNLCGTKVSNLAPLTKLPLRELTLNEYCTDLSSLANIASLKILHVPRGAYKLAPLRNLRPDLKIIEYDQEPLLP